VVNGDIYHIYAVHGPSKFDFHVLDVWVTPALSIIYDGHLEILTYTCPFLIAIGPACSCHPRSPYPREVPSSGCGLWGLELSWHFKLSWSAPAEVRPRVPLGLDGLDANDRRRRLHASGRDFNRILELSRHYYKEMIALITLEYIPKITTFKFGSTQFSKEDTV